MEMTASAPWLDISHPNYERWKRGRELSICRGRFIESLINQNKQITNSKILDLGSGEGGTSVVLSEKNSVLSLDISFIRLQRQMQNFGEVSFLQVNADARHLPLPDLFFDVIIVQDVIEHLIDIDLFIEELKRVLKPGGVIHLSTPNRNSFFNLISDPHWGLPFLSLFKRETIRNYYLNRFRKSEVNRNDIAELFSLSDLIKCFHDSFDIKLNTVFSVKALINGNKGIVWSSFHLFIVRTLKILRLDKLLLLTANDKAGLINNYFTPTFYITLTKL
jgi:ubiquinone/menaquinone biosynthesis C-methylase UbiE